MLPKISSALVRFVAPLTAPEQSTTQDRDPHPQKQNSDSPDNPEAQNTGEHAQSAQVIPINDAAKEALEAQADSEEGSPASKQAVTPPPQNGPSVAHAFVQLLNSFKAQGTGGGVLKWFGTRSYQKSKSNQTGARKSKKGAMLDDEIE